MTALLKASVGVGIEERVEEREVASSHDLEEDCGERMEHSKNMAKNRTDSMAALEIMTRRDTTMMVIFSRILSKTSTLILTGSNGRVCVTINFCKKLMA